MKPTAISVFLCLLLSPFATTQTSAGSAQAAPRSTGATGMADGAVMNCDEGCTKELTNVNIPHDDSVEATSGGKTYQGVSTGYTSGASAQTTLVPCGKQKRVKYTFTNCEEDGDNLVCDTPATFEVVMEDCPSGD